MISRLICESFFYLISWMNCVCVCRCSRTCGRFHTTLQRSSRFRGPKPIDFISGGNKLSLNLSLSFRQICLSRWKSWSRNLSGLSRVPSPSLTLRSDKMFKHTPGAGIVDQICWRESSNKAVYLGFTLQLSRFI